MIAWLTKYQSAVRYVYCPVVVDISTGRVHTLIDSSGTSASTNTNNNSIHLIDLNTNCAIFQQIPNLCRSYLDGDGTSTSTGTGSISNDPSSSISNNVNVNVREGAASHLASYCIEIWSQVAQDPDKALQRHQDGTFFTRAPLDVWRMLRQHIGLAKKTNSPVLHAMLADKIAITMTVLINAIIEWVEGGFDTAIAKEEKQVSDAREVLEAKRRAGDGDYYDPSDNTNDTTIDKSNSNSNGNTNTNTSDRGSSNGEGEGGLKQIQFEFLCALANDNALHIEEVYEVIEQFDSYARIETVSESEISGSGSRDGHISTRIENIFDPVISLLVKCGNCCLKKLSKSILGDVEDIMNEIFTSRWLAQHEAGGGVDSSDEDSDEDEEKEDEESESKSGVKRGQQVPVVLATVDDYFNDFLVFLNPFWSRKFVVVMLESLTVRYARSVIFRNKGKKGLLNSIDMRMSTMMGKMSIKTKTQTQTQTQSEGGIGVYSSGNGNRNNSISIPLKSIDGITAYNAGKL